MLRASFIGMQRIAVAAQCADARAMVRNNFLEFRQGRGILEHRQFAMRIAGIVSCSQLDGIDMQGFQFLENCRQWKLRQQWREDTNSHKKISLGIKNVSATN